MIAKSLSCPPAGFSLAVILAQPLVAGTEWQTLFNGKDLAGWKVVLDNAPPGEDPKGYVQVKDGAVHMYADTDAAEKVPFGVILSEKSYSSYHLTFEYRWGGKKFPPRKDAIRDAGVVYHVTGPEKIWPDSMEYQIQEGDTGDIVFLPKGALTWMRPDPKNAPEGQGDPGMLPEEGGTPKVYAGVKGFGYVGRYPVYDTVEGWNRVDLIVHGDEAAEHLINGKTKARLRNIRTPDGKPAGEGKIALQLEGAEVLYRDVRIRELGKPLAVSQEVVSLSVVKGKLARKAEVVVKNPSDAELPMDVSITGKDASRFKVTGPEKALAAGASAVVTVEFTGGDAPGRYSAGLQIGGKDDGAFVVLQGIHLAAFEGGNEPPLQAICSALGIPVNTGGEKLELDTKGKVIGNSVAAPFFRAAGPGKVRFTPVARFSPPGKVPFGIIEAGSSEFREVGLLGNSVKERPDAHQSLFPPLDDGKSSVEIDAPGKPFAIYMKGHKYVSFTDPSMKTDATIPNTARVYPVTLFQGKPMEHAWLVGFEEAANGDYQDAVFLLENVDPVP